MQQDDRLQMLAPEVRFVKGSYFALSGKSPFSHLVYPVPSEQGLGVHATLDMAGCTRFGPDTEAVDEIDYHVDAGRQGIFEESIRRYWPGLADGRLMPAYAGIRPKLYAGGSGQDFLIQGPGEFGMDALVFLHGIESPGLTASMSLAGTVCDRLSF